jgi:hypothetical protein
MTSEKFGLGVFMKQEHKILAMVRPRTYYGQLHGLASPQNLVRSRRRFALAAPAPPSLHTVECRVSDLSGVTVACPDFTHWLGGTDGSQFVH